MGSCTLVVVVVIVIGGEGCPRRMLVIGFDALKHLEDGRVSPHVLIDHDEQTIVLAEGVVHDRRVGRSGGVRDRGLL